VAGQQFGGPPPQNSRLPQFSTPPQFPTQPSTAQQRYTAQPLQSTAPPQYVVPQTTGQPPQYQGLPPATGAGPLSFGGPPPQLGAPSGGLIENVPPLDPNGIPGEEPDQFVILEPTVEEARTGRLMFGVGVNSDAGLVGNVVLEEQNFDITRYPTSFYDFYEGTAFRGAGQRLRLEAVPGTEVQRYMFNFSEPYLFDTPISFGVSGFIFDRRFRDWTESRQGGQLSLGYQLSPDLSVSTSVRAQDVRLDAPRVPTPPEVLEVLGETDLYTARVALAHDTRDSAFLPTEGHLIELAYEQGFGEFDFPRGTLDLRQFFLIRQRPDGSGRHVLGLSTQVGVTGSNTPVFENFFAGGTTTIRGFRFRGASPVNMGTIVGGELQILGSAEYLFPITADDALRAVAFVDFGTVEEKIEVDFDNFRVAPGFGLRISVPALGPAPIALDLAFPIAHADGDDIQNFSFRVGLFR
jgi:outer membrane protein insertion porin family